MKNRLKRRNGYLMVEVFVAICISLVVMSTVSIMFNESISLVEQTDSRIELMEQFSEMKGTIKRELRNSYNFRFYKKGNNIKLGDEFTEIDRMKFSRFDDVKNGVTKIKERDLYINESKRKIFMRYNGGNYEIGNYAVGMEVKQESENCYAIKLKLNKSNNQFSDIINIRLRN